MKVKESESKEMREGGERDGKRGRKKESVTSSGRMWLQARSEKIDTCECVEACRISPWYSGNPLVNTPSSSQRCPHQSQCTVYTHIHSYL